MRHGSGRRARGASARARTRGEQLIWRRRRAQEPLARRLPLSLTVADVKAICVKTFMCNPATMRLTCCEKVRTAAVAAAAEGVVEPRVRRIAGPVSVLVGRGHEVAGGVRDHERQQDCDRGQHVGAVCVCVYDGGLLFALSLCIPSMRAHRQPPRAHVSHRAQPQRITRGLPPNPPTPASHTTRHSPASWSRGARLRRSGTAAPARRESPRRPGAWARCRSRLCMRCARPRARRPRPPPRAGTAGLRSGGNR